jgi:hypothetical protein
VLLLPGARGGLPGSDLHHGAYAYLVEADGITPVLDAQRQRTLVSYVTFLLDVCVQGEHADGLLLQQLQAAASASQRLAQERVRAGLGGPAVPACLRAGLTCLPACAPASPACLRAGLTCLLAPPARPCTGSGRRFQQQHHHHQQHHQQQQHSARCQQQQRAAAGVSTTPNLL